MATINKVTREARLRSYVGGIQKYLLNVASLTLATQQIAPSALVTRIQHCIDTFDAIVPAKAAYHDAVLAAQQEYAQLVPLLSALRSYVIALYKGATGTLADFGIVVPQRQKPTVATKAVAVARILATRTARHTMGKRQKAKVHGSVPIAVAPAPSPAAAPAAANAPATSLPSGNGVPLSGGGGASNKQS